jgi:hypothetical protein
MALTQVQTAMLGTGAVLQVVQGTYSTSTSTASASAVATGLTVSITPKFSTSRILAIVSLGACYTSAAGAQGTYYLYRNGLSLTAANAQIYGNNSTVESNQSFSYVDSPATTSSTTYAVYFNASGGSAYVSLNGSISTIILMEIAG